jgi:hypothetical protein
MEETIATRIRSRTNRVKRLQKSLSYDVLKKSKSTHHGKSCPCWFFSPCPQDCDCVWHKSKHANNCECRKCTHHPGHEKNCPFVDCDPTSHPLDCDHKSRHYDLLKNGKVQPECKSPIIKPITEPISNLGIFSAALEKYNYNNATPLTKYEFAELVLPKSIETSEYGFYFACGPMLTYRGPGSMTRTVRACLEDLDDATDLVERFHMDSYPSQPVMIAYLVHFLESRFQMFL